jgi:hypothetical protein
VGRPRKNPQDVRLPKYVYLKKGRYVHVAPLGSGKLGPETVLAPGAAPLRQVWEAYEALRGDVGQGTLHWLCAKYLESPVFHRLQHTTTIHAKTYARLFTAVACG